MNTEIITKRLTAAKDFVSLHAVTISIVLLVSVFGFMVARIYQLSSAEPTQAQIDEKLVGIKALKLDESTVSIIKSLEDRNISIESLFNNGRTNPFE